MSINKDTSFITPQTPYHNLSETWELLIFKWALLYIQYFKSEILSSAEELIDTWSKNILKKVFFFLFYGYAIVLIVC